MFKKIATGIFCAVITSVSFLHSVNAEEKVRIFDLFFTQGFIEGMVRDVVDSLKEDEDEDAFDLVFASFENETRKFTDVDKDFLVDLRQVARKRFAEDPEFLRAFYKVHKNAVVKVLKEKAASTVVAKNLIDFLTAFTAQQTKADVICLKLWEDTKKEKGDAGILCDNIRMSDLNRYKVLEWKGRRQKENPKLPAVFQDIAADLLAEVLKTP